MQNGKWSSTPVPSLRDDGLFAESFSSEQWRQDRWRSKKRSKLPIICGKQRNITCSGIKQSIKTKCKFKV